MNYPIHANTPAQDFLGALLSDHTLISKYKNIPKGLFVETHDRKVFESILALHEKFGLFDTDTLAKELGSEGIDDCFMYVSSCHVCCPNYRIHHVYADRLYQHALGHYIEKMTTQARQGLASGDNEKVIQELETKISKLKTWKQHAGLPTIGENFQSFYEKICADHDSGGEKTVHFGYKMLDASITSLSPGELHIIGARPGIGKSMMALNIAYKNAKRNHHVLYFSLEMNEKEMVTRLLGIDKGITSQQFAFKTDSFISELGHHFDAIRELPLSFCYRSGITCSDIESHLIKERESHPVDLIIIDHMHIMQAHGTKSGYEKMTAISNGLKILAMNNQIPIIALAQLSRAGATGEPTLTELRDSGSIEQDADTVSFLTRETEKDTDTTLLKLLLRKNRNGEGYANIPYRVDFSNYQIREL